jgi:hypothetical protein
MVGHTVTFSDPHVLTDGDAVELTVDGYEDVGSMYILELTDGTTQSVGKQLVETISEQSE